MIVDGALARSPSAPHDLEAEARVLGALLIDREAIIKVADFLEADDFYSPKHQRIFTAVASLFERHEPIDALTVQVELVRRGELERAGGVEFLRDLQEAVATAVEVERDGRAVANRSALRRLLASAQDIAAMAYDEPTDLDLALDRAEQRVFVLLQRGTGSLLRHIRYVLEETYDRIAFRIDHPSDVVGVATGYPEIDVPTNGLQKGDFFVLAARPAVGKSSLALNIAYRAARRGQRVLVFSLEMSRDQLAQRLMALHASVDLLAMREGQRDPGAATGLIELPIEIDDTPGISVMELRTKARRRQAASGLDLIVIDYVQLMRTAGDDDNRVQEIATITRNIKALARELGVAVIALSQLSRAVEERETAEPRLSDLRESGALEQDADEVLFLWTKQQSGEEVRTLEAHLAKNRNGPTARFQLLFQPRFTRFLSRDARFDG